LIYNRKNSWYYLFAFSTLTGVTMPEVLIGGKNKTQIVKETLTELGFLTENRPADWVNKTRRALLKKHVTVHETVIYQTRKAHALAQRKGCCGQERRRRQASGGREEQEGQGSRCHQRRSGFAHAG
jgi:hypothetical protein